MWFPSDREGKLTIGRKGVIPRIGMEATLAVVGIGGNETSSLSGPVQKRNWNSCKGGFDKDSGRHVIADSVPWPSAEVRAFPAERQHWCPPPRTTPPHHTAQCPRIRTLSWCFFAAMSMTSAMAASSRTPSSRLLPTLGLPMGKLGLRAGATA